MSKSRLHNLPAIIIFAVTVTIIFNPYIGIIGGLALFLLNTPNKTILTSIILSTSSIGVIYYLTYLLS